MRLYDRAPGAVSILPLCRKEWHVEVPAGQGGLSETGFPLFLLQANGV